MKLIVGLGNPGDKYKNNRHNVGVMFIDFLLATCNSQLVTQNKNEIIDKKLHVISYKLKDFILAKPLTFMNNSGQAVKKLITEYRLLITDLLVIHDDLDIPLGKFKIQKGVGPRLHNGIESIEKAVGSKVFWRVRIGVDNRQQTNWIDGETYTLQDFKPEEKKIVNETFSKILDQLQTSLILSLRGTQ